MLSAVLLIYFLSIENKVSRFEDVQSRQSRSCSNRYPHADGMKHELLCMFLFILNPVTASILTCHILSLYSKHVLTPYFINYWICAIQLYQYLRNVCRTCINLVILINSDGYVVIRNNGFKWSITTTLIHCKVFRCTGADIGLLSYKGIWGF